MTSSTEKLLAEMTDEGAFERLATAVLREADPRYSSLAHPGVNADGKTVKAPVDGITYVPGARPAQLIAVHHTTTRPSDLKSKWLHDPATVKPRRGGRPTAPAGDFIKTAKIVAEERSRNPELEAILVLTTNQEPTVDIVRDVHDEAAKNSITIDLWPRSRLAHFLDKPEGQWLRHAFLGIEPEHLSRDLLHKLSLDSANNYKPVDDQNEAWVDRSLDHSLANARSDIVFVVAESGFGKSVACYKRLIKHLGQGGVGFFLPHEILESAVNLNQALSLALQQLHPHLVSTAGDEAQALCDSQHPLLLVVEDINRSSNSVQLLEKLASWSTRSEATKGAPECRWQVLCPVWPEILLSLKDQARKRIEALSINCAPLTIAESTQAVQRRATLGSRTLSNVDAEAISRALGHDPLLIALHAPGETPDPHRVVDDFITSSLSRTAYARPEFTAPDYQAGLSALAKAMLTHRILEPGWSEIISWFGLAGAITYILRGLLKHGEIVRLASSAPNARLRFRHDRVRESILSSGLAAMMRDGDVDESILSDPFFAEIIGGAVADTTILTQFIEKITNINPLALFYALRRVGSPNGPNYQIILAAINSWLDRDEAHDSAHEHLRWQALWVLAQTEAPDVVALTKRFRERGWNAYFARLRNGDVSGGIELCQRLEPGTNAAWRDTQIDHAKMRFGKNLTLKVAEVLERGDIAGPLRVGTLRLAGHLAEADLSHAIATSWTLDRDRDSHLEDYLWAGAQCCGDNPRRLLEPVCDAWAQLPSKKDGTIPSPREDMAAHNVRFAFRRWPPANALGYLIQRAKEEELSWPILYLLHEIDHPDTLEFVAHELARMARRAAETGGFSHFGWSATDRWDQDRRRELGPMSTASKSRLLALWTQMNAEQHLREAAFSLWAASASEGDLDILRTIAHEDELFNKALFQRLKRGDQQAIPDLLKKLQTERADYWWQAGRYLWSDEMTEALDESLSRRRRAVSPGWEKPEYGTDWIVSECILRLPDDVAERLLIKHWDHLRYVPEFVQAALHTSTPAMRSLVEETMSECPAPKTLMRFIDSHYGINTRGGAGVSRLAQLESLIPYFRLFSELSMDCFWRHCNKQGWFEFRRKHLDPLISHPRYVEQLGGDGTAQALDSFVEQDRLVWMDHWLEDCIGAGATVEQLMEDISSWLAAKRTIKALEVVSKALVHIGRRKDLPILRSVLVEPHDVRETIISDTTFAVMHRTLH